MELLGKYCPELANKATPSFSVPVDAAEWVICTSPVDCAVNNTSCTRRKVPAEFDPMDIGCEKLPTFSSLRMPGLVDVKSSNCPLGAFL